MNIGRKGRRRKGDFSYRPYDPTFHPQNLIELMSIGLTNTQIYDDWNISEHSFYRWRKEHQELEEAYQVGIPKFESYMIENKLMPMIEGKVEGKHSFSGFKYLMDNKAGWTKGVPQGNTTNISINNVAISQESTATQLIDKIKENFKFLTDKNVLDAEYKVIEDQSHATKSNEQDS